MTIWINKMGNKILWTTIFSKIKDCNQFKNKRILNIETVQIDTNKDKNNNLEITKILILIHKGIITQE